MRGRSSGKTGPPVPGLTRVGGGAINFGDTVFSLDTPVSARGTGVDRSVSAPRSGAPPRRQIGGQRGEIH